MSNLVIMLTPPPKDSRTAKMSPRSYLASDEAISPMKRKSGFERLDSSMTKKFKFDPSIEKDDSTIDDYYERTQKLLPNDRLKLNIHIPFGAEIVRIQGKMKNLTEENQDLKKQIENLDRRVENLDRRVEDLSKEAEQSRGQKEISEKGRLKMFIANALIKLARFAAKRFRGNLVDEQSTVALQQFALKITDAQLRELNIPPKFWKPFRDLHKMIEARNQLAHENEVEFAKLLLEDQYKDGNIFHFWKDIFPVVWGQTIGQLAAKKTESGDDVFCFE